jgi:hypothetical protein
MNTQTNDRCACLNCPAAACKCGCNGAAQSCRCKQ